MYDWFSWWLTGFFDAEGTLGTRKMSGGESYIPRLMISLRDDDSEIIHRIRDHFGCGNIYYGGKRKNGSNPRCSLEIGKIEDLAEKVVPFFDRYPLRAKKSREYSDWRELVMLYWSVKKRKVIHKKAGYGSERKWREDEVDRSRFLAMRIRATREYSLSYRTEPFEFVDDDSFRWWVTGLVDGEGSFILSVTNKKTNPSGEAKFYIGMRIDDTSAVGTVAKTLFLTRGVNPSGSNIPVSTAVLRGSFDLKEGVISHFDRYPLQSRKGLDYPIWKKGVELCIKLSSQKFKAILVDGGGPNKLVGSQKKWTPEVFAEFKEIHDSLRKVREYKKTPPNREK